MRMETTIYSDGEKRPIATIDGALMPPAGAKVIIGGRYQGVVSDRAPEIYIDKPHDERDDQTVSICITVKDE